MNTELLDSVKPGDDLGDLSGLNDLDLGSDMSGAFGDDISNLDIALDTDQGITIDDDSDTDEVASILASNKGDLEQEEEGEIGTLSNEMDLGGLEDLDINNIDLDQELGDSDSAGINESKPAPPPEKSPPVTGSKNPIIYSRINGGVPVCICSIGQDECPGKTKGYGRLNGCIFHW